MRKSMQEFEQEERDVFPDEEPINTKTDENEVEDRSTQVSETLLKTEYRKRPCISRIRR